jgi:26S proteasome regulatory subunit N1
LKDKLELLVQRLTDRETAQQQNAISLLKTEITSATASITSVPTPLKFLSPLYKDIKAAYETYPAGEMKVRTSSNIYSALLLSKDNLKRSLTNFVVFF